MTHPPTQNIMILKKKKVVKISTLDNKLWKLFSKYIRLRDRIQDEYCKCISCGSIHHWKDMHAGHFIGRRHKGVKFNEKNVSAQCCKCNTYNSGEQWNFGKALEKKYGEGVIDELEVKKQLNKNMCDRFWYIEQIKIYKEKVRKLETS